MPTLILLSLYHWGITKLENFSQTRFWAAKTILIIILASLLFHAFPGVRTLIVPGTTFTAVFMKADDLTRDLTLDFDPGSNMAKQNFRLVMPILASIFHLSAIGLYVVQLCFGIGVLYLTLRLSERLTRDRVTATLITILIATIFAGATGFVEVAGRFDAPSLFFLMLAMYTRNPLVIIASVFIASWNDERGLIASSLVFAFHFMSAANIIKPRMLTSLIRPTLIARPLAVILAWAFYFISRLAFASYFGINTPSIDLVHYILWNSNWWPFGIWVAFEGGWLLIFAAICILMAQKRYMRIFLLLGGLTIVLLVAFSVVDVSRSTAYTLPAIFIAVQVIGAHEKQKSMRVLVFVSALVAVLWPMYYLENGAWWIRPFPFQIFT